MSSQTAMLLGLLPLGFLAGSIPFGFLIGKARGIDIRSAGSKNIGATNAGRLLGTKWFFVVFVLDVLKSALPLVVARLIIGPGPHDAFTYFLWLMVGFFALLGHIFTPWLGFRGGKGVATGFGVMLGLWPYFTLPGLMGLGIFLAVLAAYRYISLASIFGAAAFPLFYLSIGLWLGWPVFSAQWPLGIFAFLMALLVIIRHKDNIRRLMAGTENKIRSKNNPPQPPPAPTTVTSA